MPHRIVPFLDVNHTWTLTPYFYQCEFWDKQLAVFPFWKTRSPSSTERYLTCKVSISSSLSGKAGGIMVKCQIDFEDHIFIQSFNERRESEEASQWILLRFFFFESKSVSEDVLIFHQSFYYRKGRYKITLWQ